MKKIKCIYSNLFLMLLVCTAVFAQDVKSVAPIKVACIGNSITYGSGIQDREKQAYPYVLGTLLGNEYEVKNFGVSGRTLLKKGDHPYWNEKAYQNALEFLPDIVIIKLGTNDTKPQNWKYKEDFEKDYSDLIESFTNLPSKPRVIICKPVPAFKLMWGINDTVIVSQMIPAIEKLAKEKNVEQIDLYTPFKNSSEFFPDGIHPNAKGAELMANEIYKHIVKK